MGWRDAFKLLTDNSNLDAQLDPYIYPAAGVIPWGLNQYAISRESAMQVPAVARARNMICNTISSLPLELWNSAGDKMPKPGWMNQPDKVTPRAVTLAWLVDSILFYGVGYLQVTAVYAQDGRPMNFTWIDSRRVMFNMNSIGTQVTQYSVDGYPVPDSGVGSLITFQGTDEGVINRAGQTISAALALETAAYNMAKDPAPLVTLKNTGVDLTSDQISDLLAAWKTARQSKSTAYLNSSVDAKPFGFNAEEMQLVQARQYVASEIARFMNVPAWIVNADSGTSMTYSNVVENRKEFVAALRGLISAIEDRLSMDDITAMGNYVRFSLDAFLREDAKSRAEVLTMLLGDQAAQGIITIDEARAYEGLSPRGNA